MPRDFPETGSDAARDLAECPCQSTENDCSSIGTVPDGPENALSNSMSTDVPLSPVGPAMRKNLAEWVPGGATELDTATRGHVPDSLDLGEMLPSASPLQSTDAYQPVPTDPKPASNQMVWSDVSMHQDRKKRWP